MRSTLMSLRSLRSLALPQTSLRLQPLPLPYLSASSPLTRRYNSTSSTSRTQSPTQSEATVFSSKSSPRTTYDSPETSRGMPPPSAGYQRPQPLTSSQAANQLGNGPNSSRPTPRSMDAEEAFKGPSRPRLIYERPGERDLPKITNKLPYVVALGLLGLGWGLFLLHATNAERLSSSVLRQVTFQLRNSKEAIAVLGENVRLVENWWALGQPWISGTINLMQGRVDLSFRVKGDKGAGTVYFTSIRPQEQGAWRIVRYKIIADDGEVVRLENLDMGKVKV
ncbi:uncharacterized protein I303_102796 [Kwoniella dejecticola CBS 10117]|uniref:DUF1783-domain-containing protein n=1 Tax=Kwoniella dejecticola CBS 10117 TaxID=1296121 RepID=A0A1A6A9R6_9TREE|nr:uncharacterized protein I303_02811 [Kwoniella dejecticola CBS 10117]OBR86796.1 hypothetical protein I303_02811 [Kwoniella dejecticola CBS 10117]